MLLATDLKPGDLIQLYRRGPVWRVASATDTRVEVERLEAPRRETKLSPEAFARQGWRRVRGGER